MAYENFVVLRIPDTAVNEETKKLLRPPAGTFNRIGAVLDDQKNERVFYFEFLTEENKAEYLRSLGVGFARYLVANEPIEQLVGPE